MVNGITPIKSQLQTRVQRTVSGKVAFAQSRQQTLLAINKALRQGNISAVDARRLQAEVKRGGALLQQESISRSERQQLCCS